MSGNDALQSIARQLFGEELRGDSVEELAQALRGSTARLLRGFSPVLGTTGTRLILTRALKRSAGRWPFVGQVAVFDEGVEAENAIRGLSPNEKAVVREACEDVLEGFFETLAGMVSPELTAVLAREVIAKSHPPSQAKNDEDEIT